MNIGQQYFKVEERNNFLGRTKLFFVDENGDKWSRYSKELWEYSIVPSRLIGKVEFVLMGNVPAEYADAYRAGYIFENLVTGKHYETYDYDLSQYFETEELAQAYIEEMKVLRDV